MIVAKLGTDVMHLNLRFHANVKTENAGTVSVASCNLNFSSSIDPTCVSALAPSSRLLESLPYSTTFSLGRPRRTFWPLYCNPSLLLLLEHLPPRPFLPVLPNAIEVFALFTEPAEPIVQLSVLPVVYFHAFCVIVRGEALLPSVGEVIAGLLRKSVTALFVQLVDLCVLGIAHGFFCCGCGGLEIGADEYRERAWRWELVWKAMGFPSLTWRGLSCASCALMLLSIGYQQDARRLSHVERSEQFFCSMVGTRSMQGGSGKSKHEQQA